MKSLVLIAALFLFGISLLSLDTVTATYQGYGIFSSTSSGGGMATSCQIINNSYFQFSYDVNIGTITARAWLQNDLYEADLSSWDSVWIVIRGSQGGEELWAEFKDCGPHYPKVKISNHLISGINRASLYSSIKVSDYLEGGITTTWRSANIPLDAFVTVTEVDTDGYEAVVYNQWFWPGQSADDARPVRVPVRRSTRPGTAAGWSKLRSSQMAVNYRAVG